MINKVLYETNKRVRFNINRTYDDKFIENELFVCKHFTNYRPLFDASRNRIMFEVEFKINKFELDTIYDINFVNWKHYEFTI